jgi:hypothetical protein
MLYKIGGFVTFGNLEEDFDTAFIQSFAIEGYLLASNAGVL